ncbi:MAG TPA: hypothetical protein VFR81_18605 [Longimicrobium sp.]|nr:hypothetical protein [Longimicrobium sp.]
MHARLLLAIQIVSVLLAGHAGAQATLPNLGGARAITGQERWPGRAGEIVGLGYVVERQDDEGFFAGGGAFVVRSGAQVARRQNALFAIPPEVARRFLAALSAVPVAAPAAGTEPLTEDSAAVMLQVDVDGTEVKFLLAAHAEQMGPWQVTIRDAGPERRLVSQSDAVWRAFRALQPHLKRDVLEALRRGEDGG